MSASEDEMRKIAREEVKRFWTGASLVALAGVSAINLFLYFFVVPKFQQIFVDALPGKPLPLVTEFIINFRLGIALVTFGWTVACAFFWIRQKHHVLRWIAMGMIWLTLQIGITIFEIFIPLVDDGPHETSDIAK